MSLPDNLPHKCDIYKEYNLPDDLGGDYDDPAAVSADVVCWVQPAEASQINQFRRRDQNVTHSVYFRTNPGVRPGYIIEPKNGRITCPFAGATLEVKASKETTAGLGVLWLVICEEVQPR